MAQAVLQACRTVVVGITTVLGVLWAGSASAQASGWGPDGYFLELGRSARDTDIAGAGLRWDWTWQAHRWGGRFNAATELTASYWSATRQSGRYGQAHVAVVPLLRWRPAEGASAWFLEAGVGLSLHPRRHEEGDVHMSTRWNFYDVLAVGHSLGPNSELSLRAVHVSNASIRRPNPGADIVTLRWARRF